MNPYPMSSSARTLNVVLLAICLGGLCGGLPVQADVPRGAAVSYQLPAEGPLPKTWRVTLAITDPNDPQWIVSQFVRGEVRTVTAENQGRFTEYWDGLDENYMPLPPGEYGVKGIYMPAESWYVTGKPRTLRAKYHSSPFSWAVPRDNPHQPPKVHGDPVGSGPGDIAIAPNGIGVFAWLFLENGLNNFLFDLNKPIGYEQVVRGFGSGGAGGGAWTATDGEVVWTFCTDGGTPFIFRPDFKPFGTQRARYRHNVYLPEGLVCGMAAARDEASNRSLVYIAERGRYVENPGGGHDLFREGEERLNRVRVLHGDTAEVLAEIAIPEPEAVAVRDNTLYVLHRDGQAWAVRSVTLKDGLPVGGWQRAVPVRGVAHPVDLDVDSKGRIYVCDPLANQVYQLKADGSIARRFGRRETWAQGSYDPLSFLRPWRVVTWTDPAGADRVLVIERAGPARVSEWSADGKLLREWQTLQPGANNGFAVDPQQPSHVYLTGCRAGDDGDWLVRFNVDYATGGWTVDAVWSGLRLGRLGWPRFGDSGPAIIHTNGRKYVVFRRGRSVYRFEGDRLVPSAAVMATKDTVLPYTGPRANHVAWHDANNNGEVDAEELRPIDCPQPFSYWGERWQADLSAIGLQEGGRDVWQLSPESFDAHGNPVYREWRKLTTDPVMAARLQGPLSAVRGGNEIYTHFNDAWRSAVLTPGGDLLVNHRCGTFSANHGHEQKITRYVPDGAGGYRAVWRVGRSANITGEDAAFAGAIWVTQPAHGLFAVIDQTRANAFVFTADEGLFVDSLVLDGDQQFKTVYGSPGEFFAGDTFLHKDSGKVYLQWGKWRPLLFEIDGWDRNLNIQPIGSLPGAVVLAAGQIADPPDKALLVRGGAGRARYAKILPAVSGAPALDGAMTGWDTCEPVVFEGTGRRVEARLLYDRDNLYLRWRLQGQETVPLPALDPLERIFTHDRGADTLSFYLQCDPAATGRAAAGRPGDVRLIFGLFTKDGMPQPAVVGLYPSWHLPGKGQPVTYGSPVGKTSFAHAGAVPGVETGFALDADGKGFVIAARIPRSALPPALPDLATAPRLMGNFEATFSGSRKIWWANADGTASTETVDEPSEARLYPGAWVPIQFVPLAGEDGLHIRSWQVNGPWPSTVREGQDGNWKVDMRDAFDAAQFPPDETIDLAAEYPGSKEQGVGVRRWVLTQTKGETPSIEPVIPWLGRLYFAVSWIYAPEALEVDVTFLCPQSHNVQTWQIGDQEYRVDRLTGRAGPEQAGKAVLAKGWNLVRYRGYATGYRQAFGLRVNAPQDVLWQLKFSPNPPCNPQENTIR